MRFLEPLFGFVIALHLLVGRWSPSRLEEGAAATDLIVEPRLWVVLGLCVVAALAPPRPPRRRGLPGYLADYGSTAFWAIAYLSYRLASISWSPDLSLALGKGYEVLIVAISTIGLVVGLHRLRGDRVADATWQFVVVLTGVLAVLALATFDERRLSVAGGGPNVFGRNMGLLMLGCVQRWFHGGRPLIWVNGAMLAFLLIVLSGSRGALASILVSLGAMVYMDWAAVKRQVILLCAGVAVGVGGLSYTAFGSAVVEMFQERVMRLTIEEGYTSYRGNLYQDAWDMGLENPVFGTGLAGFYNQAGTYPHNIALETFAEGGGLGVALLAILLATFLRALWKIRDHLDMVSVAGFVLLFTASQFSGDLYDSRGVFLYLFLALAPRTR